VAVYQNWLDALVFQSAEDGPALPKPSLGSKTEQRMVELSAYQPDMVS
jgi:hypothetical protein